MIKNKKTTIFAIVLAFALILVLNISFIIAPPEACPGGVFCYESVNYGGTGASVTLVNSTVNKITGYGGDTISSGYGLTGGDITYWCHEFGNTCYGGNAAVVSMSGGSQINITGATFDLDGGYAYQDYAVGTDGADGNIAFTGVNYFSTYYGKIGWNALTLDTAELASLTSAVIIGRNAAYVNPATISDLNTNANITLDLTGLGISNPRILKDGGLCSAPNCIKHSYTDNLIVFGVTGFSNYTTEESPLPPGPGISFAGSNIANGSVLIYNSTTINVTVSSNVSTCILSLTKNATTTNYTMTVNNAESLTNAYYSLTNLQRNITHSYNVWCNNSAGTANTSETRYVLVRNFIQPTSSEFSTGAGSTDFSLISDFTSVSSMTLATAHGSVKWNSEVYADSQNFDDNVVIDSRFVSVDSSALDTSINSSANITLSGANCNAYTIYYAAGTYTTRDNLIASGHLCNATTDPNCTNIACAGGVLTFTVSHFTGFAIGDNSGLVIFDSNDTEGGSKTVNALENAIFYANYTNLTSGGSINGSTVSCQIKFKILSNWTQAYNMTFNATSKLYEYTKAFSNYGTYTWNASCNDTSGAYSGLQATDTIVINGTAPEIPGGAGQGGSGGGGGAGPGQGTVNATLPNVVAINLTVDTVDFGDMTPGEQKANLSGIRIQNDGTLRVNIDIGGTDLWTAPHSFPGDNYLFKIAEAGEGGPEAGTFDEASLMSWTQMSTASALSIFNLNILDAHDIVAIHVNVTVPLGEPAGLKTSTLTLTAYSV